MELADGGDLLGQINTHKKRGTTFPEAQVWSIFVQIMKGLKTLHDMRILHRDLKCANVFMCRDGTIKLGDMNVSKVAKTGLVYTQTGTPYYASPEVWRDQPYDSKSDIWSVGCVLYELIALQPPFRASDMQGLYKKVIRGQYPDIPSSYSQDLASVVHTLLQVNPALRPSCDRLLAMPILLRTTTIPQTGETMREQPGLLGTIKVPRNLSSLTDRLPAPNYEKKPRSSLQPPSIKHELEKPPSNAAREMLANRGREMPQQPHTGRSLSVSRQEVVPAARNLSSDARQSPVVRDIPRSASREHLRLPPSPRIAHAEHNPGPLVHTPNSQVLRGDPAALRAQHSKPRANIFASPR